MSAARCAVVTGAASGIGRATAEHLVRAGWTVAGVDLSWPDEEVPFRRYPADVTDESSISAAVAQADDELGPVRGLVASAGVIEVVDPLQMEPAAFRRVLDVNVTGTFLAAQACARLMAGHGGGSIVTISSVSGLLAAPNRAAYSASKGAVIALTRSLAVDLAGRGIRVNAIAPGSVSTPLFASVQSPELQRAVLSSIPMGRFGSPEEVAAVAGFLLGEETAFVTGQTWGVDGGQSVQAGWRLPEAAA